MSREPLTVSLQSARRLAVTKQHLAGAMPRRATAATILSIIRDLAYVQWDPVSIVAPSHILSLWNRLGDFRPSDLERLLWVEKKLFEHWTPIASIVLTEDFPLYSSLMKRYPESLSRSWANQIGPAKRFLAKHSDLRKRVLRELRKGPLLQSQLKDHHRTKRDEGDWGPSSDVSEMLFHSLMSGEVMVVGHEGNQNIWGRAEDFLPDLVREKAYSEEEAERTAAERAVRALGTAAPSEIRFYFVRGRYQNLKAALSYLEKESRIRRVEVDGFGDREARYVHEEDVPLLDSMNSAAWRPRVSLLPPFDNMVIHQARTKRVFDFDYVREQFLPKEKRKFGTYVLPILWGERFIGRIDPRLDKKSRTLVVNAVHAEPNAPLDPQVGLQVRDKILSLARFVGAETVSYTPQVPRAWRAAFL